MLNRAAHGPFHPYPPCGCSGTSTDVQRRKSRRYEVPLACSMRRGAFLLLTAAIISCMLFFRTGTQLVAAPGILRTSAEHSSEEPTEDSTSNRHVLAAAAPWMREEGEKAATARLVSHVGDPSEAREASSSAPAAASEKHAPESKSQFWRPGVRGALYPRDSAGQSAEGTEKHDVKAGTDVSEVLANEGRQGGGAGMSGTERSLPKWPVQLHPAEGAHRAEDEMQKEKDTGVHKQEGESVVEGKPFVSKEAKDEAERTEKEGEDEEDAGEVQSSAEGKHRVDSGGKHEEHEGIEKGKREEEEGVEKKEEGEAMRTDGKEKEKRQNSKRSDDIKKGDKGPESIHPVSGKEGRPEEKAVQSVYTRPLFFDHPFCLFPNSPWCNADLTTQDAKSPEGVPDFIRRANAFVSSMMPFPFFYIPLSIPRFWSAEESSSVEAGGAARCRFTFTIDPTGPSEEIRLYVVPSQRRIGLTVGRNVKHSEKGNTYSGMYGTETRMHAVSSFAQGCKVSEKLLQAGLIGWSYAGKTENGVRILVTFPSEAHAKDLLERKVLSEKSYKMFVDEENLDLLTASDKCLLSGRTQNECEQLKAEAAQKREATLTLSTEGYAENEVRIPEYVYE